MSELSNASELAKALKFAKTYNLFREMGASHEEALKLAKIVFTIVTK